MSYPIIVADPPWNFQVWSDAGNGRSPSCHYATMDTDGLAALPVGNIASDSCALFLWATWPNLLEGIQVGQAWGFEYKTCAFTWVKRTPDNTNWHMGLGYYTRANTEPCLLFTRGAILPRRSQSVRQLVVDDSMLPLFENAAVVHPVSRHSQKPETVQDRIEQLFDGPYLELFARRQRPGWTCLGNEIDGMDIRDALRQGAA